MRRAFTLIEVLIVLSIIGILAAIIIPEFQDHAQKARETTAKDNLRILRTTIERYAAEHNGVPPGYADGVIVDPHSLLYAQFTAYTSVTGVAAGVKSSVHYLGPYLPQIPENPFNGKTTIKILTAAESFPDPMPASDGWYYKPNTRQIRIDWPGNDSEGTAFSMY